MTECVIRDCPVDGVVPIAMSDGPPPGFPLPLPDPAPAEGEVCASHASIVTHWLAARDWRRTRFCGVL